MAKKKVLKKHSVRANLHVKELTKAGSSLDLEIYANRGKIGTLILGVARSFGLAKGDRKENAFPGAGLRR
jgi:hypothetical protein